MWAGNDRSFVLCVGEKKKEREDDKQPSQTFTIGEAEEARNLLPWVRFSYNCVSHSTHVRLYLARDHVSHSPQWPNSAMGTHSYLSVGAKSLMTILDFAGVAGGFRNPSAQGVNFGKSVWSGVVWKLGPTCLRLWVLCLRIWGKRG